MKRGIMVLLDGWKIGRAYFCRKNIRSVVVTEVKGAGARVRISFGGECGNLA